MQIKDVKVTYTIETRVSKAGNEYGVLVAQTPYPLLTAVLNQRAPFADVMVRAVIEGIANEKK